MAGGYSTVVKHRTMNPRIKSSNPAGIENVDNLLNKVFTRSNNLQVIEIFIAVTTEVKQQLGPML